MSRLAITLLGPPRIELDGNPVHIGHTKAIALLAYLAVTATSHRREILAALLWPEFDHSGARAELRRALSALNRALGPGWLATGRETAGLNPDAVFWLDVAEFHRLLTVCDTHAHASMQDCAECQSRLADATALYDDDFMAGFTLPFAPAFDEWQRFESHSLQDGLGSALEQLAAHHAAQGEYEAAITHAQRHVELDKLHESAQHDLMELYALSGNRNASLRQYRDFVRVLDDELGLPPSAETTALYERIRAGKTTGQAPE